MLLPSSFALYMLTCPLNVTACTALPVTHYHTSRECTSMRDVRKEDDESVVAVCIRENSETVIEDWD